MKFSGLRKLMLGGVIGAVAVAGVAVVGGSPPALAAPCGGMPCLRVDANPVMLGVQSDAAVGHVFNVDIVAQNFQPAPLIGSFRFTLLYKKSMLSADAPTIAGFADSGYDCTFVPASGQLDESSGFSDGNPATGDAFLTCASTGAYVGDGPIARITFTSFDAGGTYLDLYNVEVDDTVGAEVLTCAPVVTVAAGGCLNANAVFDGPPALPPPPIPPCTVSYAIEGNLLQCDDGSKLRMIGVGSPVGVEDGAAWARTVTNWFLAGKTVGLETDTLLWDGVANLAYPHYTGTDGNDYNMSALLIYVGMAKHTPDGSNSLHSDWFNGAEGWARAACWNMWRAGNPWAGISGCS